MLFIKSQKEPNPQGKKWSGILHGVGLIAALVGGMGLMARLGGGFQPWIMVKLGLWFALGAATLTIRWMPLAAAYAVVFCLAGAAATFAVFKPF